MTAPTRRALRWFGRNRLAAAGAVILLVTVACALLPSVIEPYSPSAQIGAVFGHPSLHHPLGLDDGGVDVLSELIAGARATLLIAVTATLVAVLIGAVIGLVAGYLGGWVDILLMRFTDYVLVVPALPLAVVVAALFGASLKSIILIIGLLHWATTARIVRAQTASARNRVFVRRIRSVGASHRRILLRHVLPQVVPLLTASAVLTIATAIFTESALSFLGLGDPAHVTWGQMIYHAYQRTAMTAGAWWAFVYPGVAITVFSIACHWVGEAIDSATNPRARHVHLSPRSFRYVVGPKRQAQG